MMSRLQNMEYVQRYWGADYDVVEYHAERSSKGILQKNEFHNRISLLDKKLVK